MSTIQQCGRKDFIIWLPHLLYLWCDLLGSIKFLLYVHFHFSSSVASHKLTVRIHAVRF